MARGKKPVKTAATSKLILALETVLPTQREAGNLPQTHCIIHNKTLSTFDGIVGIGCAIDEELTAFPNTYQFLHALKRCDESYSITQINSAKLAIKSGRFQAFIDCASPDQLFHVPPDKPAVVVDDRLLVSIGHVAPLATANAQRVALASIMIRTGSVIATDGVMAWESWHGQSVPPASLPKAAATALAALPAGLTALGYSATSLTFWFASGAWLRSQLYDDPWPDVDAILNMPSYPRAVPDGFFAGIKAIEHFAKNGVVIASGDGLRTNQNETEGASYRVPDLPAGSVFRIKQIAMIEPLATLIDLKTPAGHIAFVGNNIRGVIAGHQ